MEKRFRAVNHGLFEIQGKVCLPNVTFSKITQGCFMSFIPPSLVRLACFALVSCWVGSPSNVRAQRGDLIADLFKTIAEAKLQRDRERDAANQAPAAATNERDGGNEAGTVERGKAQPEAITFPTTPPVDRGLGELGSGRPQSNAGQRSGGGLSNREATRAFRKNLSSFDAECGRLLQCLRNESVRNASIRGMLPDTYRIAADSRALLRQSGDQWLISAFRGPYARIDEGWRQLSFKIRAVDGLNPSCASSIRVCDDLVSRMSRQLRITPQFDRHELHDLMIVATTYMQSLIDDLQLARISPDEIRRLTRECRLLRQSLLSEADRVNYATYEEIISAYTDFIAGWRQFSARVYALHDRHLDRRLDRIRECGDQTYAILWMPTPYDSSSLLISARRLESACSDLLDQLSTRSMVSLDARQRTDILDTTNRMVIETKQLTKAMERRDSRAQLQDRFSSFDRMWIRLSPTFRRMNSLSYTTLSAMEYESGHLRDALGVVGDPGQLLGYEGLTELAASLESAADFLDADVRRYAQYVGPGTYRQKLLADSRSFLGDATELHELASQRGDLRSLHLVAESLLDHWQKLSASIALIESRGLPASRAVNLQRARQDLVSMVARVSAALAQH